MVSRRKDFLLLAMFEGLVGYLVDIRPPTIEVQFTTFIENHPNVEKKQGLGVIPCGKISCCHIVCPDIRKVAKLV